jgi:hypothetical protein
VALVASCVAWAAGCHTSASGTPGAGAAGSAVTGAAGGAAAGSSGAAGSVGDAGLPPIDADVSTADGFCHAVFDVVGGQFATCFGLPPSAGTRLFGDPIFCERFMASLAAGRERFDPTHAAACVAELGQAVSCDFSTSSMPSMPSMPSDCAGALAPLVPPGGACHAFAGTNLAAECTGDAYCMQGPGHCDGTCTTRAAIGQPCDSNSDLRCVSNATCDSATKRCVAAVTNAEGGPCTTSGQPGCVQGLICDFTTVDGGSSGTCRAKRSSGPCTMDFQCANAYRCAGPSGAAACTAPKAVGAACTPGLHECSLLGYCGAGNVCSETQAAIGQPCGAINGESIPCARGAYCDGPLFSAGTCRAVLQAPAACDPKMLLECGGNFGECDSTTKTCVDCPL